MKGQTPNCWAWQTRPVDPPYCTCFGCTRWRLAESDRREQERELHVDHIERRASDEGEPRR